jgi:hypothetical protein
MTDDKEQKRAYWSAILAAETKQLAALLEQQVKLVDDNGRDLTPSVIDRHEKTIAEAKRQLASIDQVWSRPPPGPWTRP